MISQERADDRRQIIADHKRPAEISQ